MTSLRLLVSGSRSWRQPTVVRHHLDLAAGNADVTLVHGAASGVDTIAHLHAKLRHWTIETHPADWTAPCLPTCQPGHRKRNKRGRDYCPAAGNYRNDHMVSLGADLCLVFWRDHSTGTRDAMTRAEEAGIEVVPFYDCACHPTPALPAGGRP